MDPETSIAEHWADRDVYGLIVSALERASKSLDSLTVEDLAPVDHFHARGFPATVDRSGTAETTTLPAPTMHSAPIEAMTTLPSPIQDPGPMRTWSNVSTSRTTP